MDNTIYRIYMCACISIFSKDNMGANYRKDPQVQFPDETEADSTTQSFGKKNTPGNHMESVSGIDALHKPPKHPLNLGGPS